MKNRNDVFEKKLRDRRNNLRGKLWAAAVKRYDELRRQNVPHSSPERVLYVSTKDAEEAAAVNMSTLCGLRIVDPTVYRTTKVEENENVT